MGIPLDSPAHIIRAIIDEGAPPPEALLLALPSDYAQLRTRILAAQGAGRKARVDMYLYGLSKLPHWVQIAHRINRANVLHEPPFPPEDLPDFDQPASEVDYPYVFDPHVWKLNYGHLAYQLPGDVKGPQHHSHNGNGAKFDKGHYGPNSQKENQIDPETKRKDLTIHTAGEALKPLPPTDWLVEGLVAAGSLTIVFGDAGTKKSYMMMSLMACATLGVPWLKFPTKQGPTLLVDEESTEAGLRRRISGVLRGLEATADKPRLHYSWLQNIDLRQQEHVEGIQRAIIKTEARLVVVDALMDVLPGADENHVRDVLPALRALRKLAAETKAAIIVIHHANKQGGFRGTSSIKGAVDLMLKVSSDPDSPYVDFESLKARDLGAQKFGAKITFSGTEAEPVVRVIDAQPGKGSKPPISSAGKYVLEYLRDNGASSVKAIKENAEGITADSAKQAVYRLVNQGLIERNNKGGKGIAAVYTLTEEGKTYV